MAISEYSDIAKLTQFKSIFHLSKKRNFINKKKANSTFQVKSALLNSNLLSVYFVNRIV